MFNWCKKIIEKISSCCKPKYIHFTQDNIPLLFVNDIDDDESLYITALDVYL